jgi:hypothetical protein
MSLDMEILADQISRAFRGESWHGPSVLEVLASVSAEDATAHPIAGAHSIWEIVLHLGGGYTLVLRRLRGERAQLSPEEEWPPNAGVQFGGLARKPVSLGGTEPTAAACCTRLPGGTPSAATGMKLTSCDGVCSRTFQLVSALAVRRPQVIVAERHVCDRPG